MFVDCTNSMPQSPPAPPRWLQWHSSCQETLVDGLAGPTASQSRCLTVGRGPVPRAQGSDGPMSAGLQELTVPSLHVYQLVQEVPHT